MPQPFRHVVGLITGALSFVYLIFVLNPIQAASVLLYPFSRRACRWVNRWCARSIWGLWVIQAEVQNGIEIRITGDRVPLRENALVLSNHQSMADVMVLLCLAWRCKRIGDVKWFVKDIIKYFPGFGWGMKFLDCIFVKREWGKDEAGIQRLFGKYKREDIPVFLVSFLEGTRLTPEKHARAQAFAKERGHHVPQHTLVPRTKGFIATIHGLRDHLDAVYDVTIGYRSVPAPTLVSCYGARVPGVDIHLRRYTPDMLPKTDEELAEWAHTRFREKDELLERHRQEGRFPGAEVTLGDIRISDWFVPETRRPQTS